MIISKNYLLYRLNSQIKPLPKQISLIKNENHHLFLDLLLFIISSGLIQF